MPATLDAARSHESALHLDHLAPLIFFYGLGSTRPQITFIQPEEVPAEERHLLVHDTDMTPRLRDHHGSGIFLDVHGKGKIGEYYVRASVLKLLRDAKAVEFGAIGIHLDLLPEEARRLVIEGKRPFGGILEEQAVPHSSHPRGYFRIKIDHRLAEVEGNQLHRQRFFNCRVRRSSTAKIRSVRNGEVAREICTRS